MIKPSSKLLTPVSGSISTYYADIIKAHAIEHKMPVSRVVAMIIDNAFEHGNPLDYDMSLPVEGTYEENAFAEEGTLFLTFMKTMSNGLGLDMLLTLRHDIGIPSKEIFLAVFAECLRGGLIEECKPPKPRGTAPAHPEGYLYYRMAGYVKPKIVVKRARQYDTYLRLKKKFDKKEF